MSNKPEDKTEITTNKIARMHDDYLSFHTVTHTVMVKNGEERVSDTEVQTGATVFGGGLDWASFHNLSDEQFQDLMTCGECNLS